MSVWNNIQDTLIERVTVELRLTEAEHRLVSKLAEAYLLEHVRVTLREGQSPWAALAEAPAVALASNGQLGFDDHEAEAIEDASGKMGMDPPSVARARQMMMDRSTALAVYKALQGNEEKYSAALGGPQQYAQLMKKVVNQLRDKLGMGAKQLNPPTSPPVKDQTNGKVMAQDITSMKGSGAAKTTVLDPKDQKKSDDMVDPSTWDWEVGSDNRRGNRL